MRKIKIFLFFLFASVSFGQSTKIDSLLILIRKNPNDLEYISLLAQHYENINQDSAYKYANMLLKKSQNNAKYSAKAYNSLANIFLVKNDLDTSIRYYQKAIESANRLNDPFDAAVYTLNLAQVYLNKSDLKKSILLYNNALKTLKNYPKNKENNFYLATIYGGLGDSYNLLGNYNEALRNSFLSLKMNLYINDPISIAINYNSIASVYTNLKDYNLALKNNKKALEYFNKTNYPLGKGTVLFNIAECFYNLNDSKSALQFNKEAESVIMATGTNYNIGNIFQLYGKIYYRNNNIEKASEFYEKAKKIHLDSGTQLYYGESLLGLGDCSLKNTYQIKAERYYLEALEIFKKNELSKSVTEAYERLLQLSIHINNKQDIQKYLVLYKNSNDKYLNNEKQKSIASEQIKYETELKEAKIKEQQLQLEKEKANRNMAFAGIGVLLLLSGSGFWLYRNKQNQKQLQTQNTLLGLQQNLNAMQLDNLNKQLDPHEIKNILASISPEIQRNAPDAYNKMTKLLNLTRASLSSNSITDSIENQLQQIEDYLALEKTVLPVPLNYSIKNTVDTRKQIPRLLLKNLVENAIKHGIKNKKEGGEINIDLTETSNKIKITVDDTGIGRHQAISLDSGIGTSTYINLFETLNTVNLEKASFNIVDKQQGTKIEVLIPLDYKYS